MGYATYDFYTNTYHGDFVDESSFSKWESRAESKLDYICAGNIDSDALEEYETKIAMATCTLVDALAKIDYEIAHINDASSSGNVKSMSSGGQSITFNNVETIYSVVLNDAKAQNKLMRDLVVEYLSSTGLMYLGD